MARKDLKALDGMGDRDVFADEIFGFHAQQAVEKTLKAWIAARGEQYPLRHSIAELLAMLGDMGCDVEDMWDLVKYTPFAVEFRYGVIDRDEPCLDRAAALSEVRSVFDRVERIAAGGGEI